MSQDEEIVSAIWGLSGFTMTKQILIEEWYKSNND